MKESANYNGEIDTKVWYIIPFLIAFSKSTISKKDSSKVYAHVYAIHITPWVEIGFNKRI